MEPERQYWCVYFTPPPDFTQKRRAGKWCGLKRGIRYSFVRKSVEKLGV